jgi:hypothetical protein
MDCREACQQLHQGEKSLALRLHLVCCGKCRGEGRALRGLERAIGAAPRSEPPAALLAEILAIAKQEPVPAAGKPIPAPWKKRRSRLVFWLIWAVIAALVALSLAAVFIIRSKKIGKKALLPYPLIKVLSAAEAKSVIHTAYSLGNWKVEAWSTPQSIYYRMETKTIGLTLVGGAEADTGRWWCYRNIAIQQGFFVADLRPMSESVYELTTKTHELLADPAKAKKFSPQLQNGTFEFETAVPAEVKNFSPPQGVRVLRVTPRIRRDKIKGIDVIYLAGTFNGQEVMATVAPVDLSQIK